jgi:hypothetical protein
MLQNLANNVVRVFASECTMATYNPQIGFQIANQEEQVADPKIPFSKKANAALGGDAEIARA